MCLSTIYIDELKNNNILASNVMTVKVNNDEVILIDLMERVTKVKGTIKEINLTDNYVIINKKE